MAITTDGALIITRVSNYSPDKNCNRKTADDIKGNRWDIVRVIIRCESAYQRRDYYWHGEADNGESILFTVRADYVDEARDALRTFLASDNQLPAFGVDYVDVVYRDSGALKAVEIEAVTYRVRDWNKPAVTIETLEE